MIGAHLILYSRNGCCLCEGLEQRLLKLPLQKLSPPVELKVVDIDSADTAESVRIRYDLIVPVMAVYLNEENKKIDLPRVSPRLKEESLFIWLQKAINKSLGLE